MIRLSVLAGALTAVLLGGCATGVHWISDPERNRVIRVESGDKWFLTLDESNADERSSLRWTATSDDGDVTVRIRHGEGEAKATIDVGPAFDGPATVVFRLCRPGRREAAKTFTVVCYRRTGDSAFWTK